MHSSVEKVVSGGQTGVGRAALDVALRPCIPCGAGVRGRDGGGRHNSRLVPAHKDTIDGLSPAHPVKRRRTIEFALRQPAGWGSHDPGGVIPNGRISTGIPQPDGPDLFNSTEPERAKVAILYCSGR
jgi:hypothetical protein